MTYPWKTKVILIGVSLLIAIPASVQLYHHRHFKSPVVKGPGVTEVIPLSHYFSGIKGTAADTPVFILKGKQPGGKLLIMANTHSNEPAGLLASIIFIENALIDQGTLYIIPVFNNSGSRTTKPGDGYPLFFDLETPWGKRRFRMGNRNASPLDQWPDPDVYIHYPDRQLLSYIDARNTNRTWPGRPDGLLMEKVTFAAMELLRREKVDLAIDLHGAETMFPVTNCIVAPEKAIRLATLASLTVKAKEGFDNHVEPSPSKFRGLSHREIGDYSDTLPFLLEAPLPFLDQPTGPKTVKLLLDGKDPFLLRLAKKAKLFVPYDESGWPMAKRVGQHCSVILELINQYSRKNPARAIRVKNVPRYKEIVAKGVGFFFRHPQKEDPKKIVDI
ncbi:MAG: succinylglutamate desuccinylase [Candidatus Aminicenantes bacterium 4484_214]|nr:MAG: succinylglutamate desuccinylase [Candidatus Aminicenantes bacterium 4484_214]RLE10754.1 MAG: succinylglutamate desuccinylase [Candidatus Aminicenantes bacterium]